MNRNSTIRQKKGTCAHPGCKYTGPLIGGKCQTHYWGDRRMNSAAKIEEREIREDINLSQAMDDLDGVFSQFIRLRDSDENGFISCYCCGSVLYWSESQCMHFQKRIHQHTRYSEENCHAGCSTCNETKDGNLKAFGEHLEEDRPGSVEILEEQARSRYSYSVQEIKSLMAHYSKEVARLKKLKPLKS